MDMDMDHPMIKSLSVNRMGCLHQTSLPYIHRPHGSDHFIVFYCFEGEGWIQIPNFEKVAITKDTAILIKPDTPYTYGSVANAHWSYYYIHISGEQAAFYFQNKPVIQRVELNEMSMKCKKLFAECDEVLKTGNSLHHLIYSSHLLGQLLSLLCLFAGEPPHHVGRNRHVLEAIQFMVQHMREHLTLQQLCEQINVSKPHLIKLFRNHTGHSPIDYFIHLKIQQACAYFDSTDVTVQEVSYELGFRDPSYFSRIFSKMMGVSPTQYRQPRTRRK